MLREWEWLESKARPAPGEKLHADKKAKPFDQIRSRKMNSDFFRCIVARAQSPEFRGQEQCFP